jgi:hypothetical protein
MHGPRPRKFLAPHRGEGRFEAAIGDAGGGHNLLSIGAPDDFEFTVSVHFFAIQPDDAAFGNA